MKKLITFLGLLFFAFTAKAQIDLLNTFSGWSYGNLKPETLFSDKYVVADTNSQIKIYNADFSLYKVVNAEISGYATSTMIDSKNIFSTNNKIDIAVSYYCKKTPTNENQKETLRIYNEDGEILKDFGFGNSMFFWSVNRVSDQYRLSVVRIDSTWTSQTEIYSLPGKPEKDSIPDPVNVNNFKRPQQGFNPYPNPAQTTITLPYQIPQSQTAILSIYNQNGQLVETKRVGGDFNRILLNVSHYKKGAYIYECNGISKKFIVQ